MTADDDNRVVLRPRTPTGFVDVVMPVSLPDEPLDIAEVLDLRGRI